MIILLANNCGYNAGYEYLHTMGDEAVLIAVQWLAFVIFSIFSVKLDGFRQTNHLFVAPPTCMKVICLLTHQSLEADAYLKTPTR